MEDATVVCGRKENPLLFHVCFIGSFGGEWFLLLPSAWRRKASPDSKTTKRLKGTQVGSGLMVEPLQKEIKREQYSYSTSLPRRWC